MKIQRIELRNFRSFAQFDLDLGGRSVFVIGENGGGKTSLLTAVARALGRDLSFTSADFASLNQPIELRVTLTELDIHQQGIFGNYVDFAAGGPTLRLQTRAVWNAAAEEAETEHGYLKQPGSRSRRDERDSIPLQWLPSNRDAGRMLQFGIATNLLGRVLENLPIQGSLNQAVEEIGRASQQLGTDAALDLLLRAARDRLAQLLPDVAPDAFSMGVSALTPRDLLRQFELVVAHLGEPVAVPRQSSGIAQLSIFVFAIMLAGNDPGRILLVDEPEISLHPQSQRALMRAMRGLGSQMLVATHSANLLDRADPRTVVRLRRSAAGIDLASPSTLSDEDARRLSRFTSPQTAEAFFARTVVLVEGMSDQLAIEALAERRGRNLDADGVAIVPMGGARTIASFLRLFGPGGFNLKLAGLCDEAEETIFAQAIESAGLGVNLTRADRAQRGFYVCVVDLEDELVRALGTHAVEQIIDTRGDLPAFRVFQNQQPHQALSRHEQLRAFIAARGRKIEYAPVLVDAIDLARVPAPLDGILAYV
jgi:AAA domain, putative AbiEii toxin, Type IV TA system/Overcoming lysogenization defect protein-like, TOPRIM domain